jgi:hypothetical protein
MCFEGDLHAEANQDGAIARRAELGRIHAGLNAGGYQDQARPSSNPHRSRDLHTRRRSRTLLVASTSFWLSRCSLGSVPALKGDESYRRVPRARKGP